jgi:hypothetical protein
MVVLYYYYGYVVKLWCLRKFLDLLYSECMIFNCIYWAIGFIMKFSCNTWLYYEPSKSFLLG